MTTPSTHVHTVQCTENNCRLPVGRIINGELVIQVKHHGEKHYARFSVMDLIALIVANVDKTLLTNKVETVTSRH